MGLANGTYNPAKEYLKDRPLNKNLLTCNLVQSSDGGTLSATFIALPAMSTVRSYEPYGQDLIFSWDHIFFQKYPAEDCGIPKAA